MVLIAGGDEKVLRTAAVRDLTLVTGGQVAKQARWEKVGRPQLTRGVDLLRREGEG